MGRRVTSKNAPEGYFRVKYRDGTNSEPQHDVPINCGTRSTTEIMHKGVWEIFDKRKFSGILNP